MNQWDKAKRVRILCYIATVFIVYSMIVVYIREGLTRTYVILTAITIVAGILEYHSYKRKYGRVQND